MRVIGHSIVMFYNSFLLAMNTINYHPACWINSVCVLMMLFAFYLEGKANEQETEIEQLKKEYLEMLNEYNNVV